MKPTTIALAVAAAAALGFSQPAEAQRRDADRARPFSPAWAAPQLQASPRGGPPGTPVTITGAGIGADDVQIFYGDTPMRILRRGDDAVVAVIPRAVRGADHIYAVGKSGRARTATRFDVGPRRHERERPRYRYDRYSEPLDDYDYRLDEDWYRYDSPYRDPYDYDPYRDYEWYRDNRYDDWVEDIKDRL